VPGPTVGRAGEGAARNLGVGAGPRGGGRPSPRSAVVW